MLPALLSLRDPPPGGPASPYVRNRVGFVIGLEGVASTVLEEYIGMGRCPLGMTFPDGEASYYTVADFTDFTDHPYHAKEIDQASRRGEGWISMLYVNCDPESLSVSFDITISMYNVLPDGTKFYSSLGEMPLPLVYGILGATFTVLFCAWVVYVVAHKADAHRIHVLMAALLVFKALTMVAKAGETHMDGKYGEDRGWSIAFYVFNSIRGMLFLLVVVLVAVGWSYMKPFLSDRDKKILMIIVPLQLFITIANIVVQEAGPATPNFASWDTLLMVAQFVCFCAILFPLAWSMKSLKEASLSDGKAARNYMKMQLFRQFYIILVAFVYFKLIILYMLRSLLPPRDIWMAPTSMEAITLGLYIFVGFKFRPARENPMLAIEMADFQPPPDSDDEEAVALTRGPGPTK